MFNNHYNENTAPTKGERISSQIQHLGWHAQDPSTVSRGWVVRECAMGHLGLEHENLAFKNNKERHSNLVNLFKLT